LAAFLSCPNEASGQAGRQAWKTQAHKRASTQLPIKCFDINTHTHVQQTGSML
jgi:hypothetical protein